MLDYWEKWTGFEGEAMRAVVDDFNQSQTEIHVRYLPVSQIERKVMLATAAGCPPDVAGLRSGVIPLFAENNALLPLDSLIAEGGVNPDAYIPVYWELMKHRAGRLRSHQLLAASTLIILPVIMLFSSPSDFSSKESPPPEAKIKAS